MPAGKNKLACQFSLYPLGTREYGKFIREIIADLDGFEGMDVEVGPMSTMIRGSQEAVWELLKKVSNKAGQRGEFVLTLTVSNVCGG